MIYYTDSKRQSQQIKMTEKGSHTKAASKEEHKTSQTKHPNCKSQINNNEYIIQAVAEAARAAI